MRARLAEFPPSFHPDKTIELLNLCRAIPELRKLKPYISLGRLCLTHNTPIDQCLAEGKTAWNQDAPCLYFHKERYVVAGYDNRDKWLFETKFEAIDFVQRHLVSVPPLADYNVLVLPAILHKLTSDWFAGTALVEFRRAAGPASLLLTGVSWCEAVRSLPIGDTDVILKIEYDHQQLLLRLSSGNYISIAATGLEIKEQLI